MGHNAMSDSVKFRRGKTSGICKEEFVTGLPCIDGDKFVSGSYGNYGNNAADKMYDIGANKEVVSSSINKHNAMVNEEGDDDKMMKVFGDADPMIMWSVISVLILFCLILGISVYLIRKDDGKAKKKCHSDEIVYDRATITNEEDEMDVEMQEEEEEERTETVTITQSDETYFD